MKACLKLILISTVIGLFILLPQKGISQHYANLGSADNNNTTSQKVKKSIISFGFFSLVNHHLSLGYDQLLGTDFIFTSQLGIIGPGITQSAYNYNPRGAFLEIGTKFFFSPTWIIDGMHRINAMQGGYFKPQLVVSSFSQSYTYSTYNNYTYTTATKIQNFTGIALLLNLGHQWIFANSFSLDMYFGIGYDLSSLANVGKTNYPYPNSVLEPNNDNYYSYLTSGASMPLAFAAGVNMGIPF